LSRNTLLDKFSEIEKKYDMSVCIDVAKRMLETELDKNERATPIIRGNVGESILTLMLDRYIEKYCLDWKVYVGMILKDPEGLKEFYTELDVTLLTSSTIVLFESKCYLGKNKIVDAGEVKTRGFSSDVYKQQHLHRDTLEKNVKGFIKPGIKGFPCELYLFYFSNYPIEDLRSKEYRQEMPIVTDENLIAVLNALKKLKTINYDYTKLVSLVDKIYSYSDKLRDKQLSYYKARKEAREAKAEDVTI
jgi:hypothetical protein